MESEDSRDAGDDHSSSSSSSSSSRSRRSSSSDKSDTSKKNAKSPPRSPQSPRSDGPRSPSPESRSQTPTSQSTNRPPQPPDNLSGAHSDINSPENSMPGSPTGPQSPDAPRSPSDMGSNIGSPEGPNQYSPSNDGPKSPQSPNSYVKSAPESPDAISRPASPDSPSQTLSPSSSRNHVNIPPSSPSPERIMSPPPRKNEWCHTENWRRHTKAEQKMVPHSRERSRSESSQSSRSSSYNKRSSSIRDPATEEISEGEMESDQDDVKSRNPSEVDKLGNKELNMSHEDLSDVSDLDSMGPEEIEKDKQKVVLPSSPINNVEVNVNGKNGTSLQSSPKSDSGKVDSLKVEKTPQEKTCNTEDCEEQLDFEAEEGECVEPKSQEQSNGDADKGTEKEDIKPGKRSRGSSLEEGEVSDEAERRPEESEPRPVCRFYSRGACTWGVSCRFLHPGVTDKGNYNMFDVVRGVPATGPYVAAPPRDVAPPESAWERGLRTAKEMLRIANKRKEQDMDFEEKKLHLSLGGVVHDPDAELAYAAAAVGASPPHHHEPPHAAHREEQVFRPYGPMYRGRFPRPIPDERERYYERERAPFERERAVYERPPHYDERSAVTEDPVTYHKRRVRSSREVIVQRAEVERRECREGREGRPREGRDGRGDEWADPWMRAEPAAKRRRQPSSEESYSSSSSRSSRAGARRNRRASSSSRHRLSPSVIVRERRLATARATAMNPPAPRRRAPSPLAARLAANPPAPARHKDEVDPYGRNKATSRSKDRKRYSRSSSSGSESSSTSSESESESHSSSSSGSSGARRARHARLLNAAARPRLNAKSNVGLAAAVAVTNKKEAPSDKETVAKKRSATSPVGGAPGKKSVSRREELLKQLKAVEDAIARKRSKI